jgi:hypothetical protein
VELSEALQVFKTFSETLIQTRQTGQPDGDLLLAVQEAVRTLETAAVTARLADGHTLEHARQIIQELACKGARVLFMTDAPAKDFFVVGADGQTVALHLRSARMMQRAAILLSNLSALARAEDKPQDKGLIAPMTQTALADFIVKHAEGRKIKTCSSETIRKAAKQAGVPKRQSHETYAENETRTILRHMSQKQGPLGKKCKAILNSLGHAKNLAPK